MSLPPALMRLRVRAPGRAWPSVWLPIFVLWPVLLLAFVLAASCGVLMLCVALQLSLARAFELVASAYALLCATRGTHVDVVGARSSLLITVY